MIAGVHLEFLAQSSLRVSVFVQWVWTYVHNGVFKNLKDVVDFYNKRNIAADASGKEIAFDLRKGSPSGYTPLFPPPEVLDNVQNVTGVSPSQAIPRRSRTARSATFSCPNSRKRI
jgi:hypothetical protein